MTRSAVLIFSKDPIIGALLGASAELAGLAPAFPKAEEAPDDALRRVGPRVALIDCSDATLCSEHFVKQVLGANARVLVFASREAARTLDEIARRVGAGSFTLPVEHAELARLLTSTQ